jgi:hypothetical protein
MTVHSQIRRINRNGMIVAALLAALGGVVWTSGPSFGFPWTLGLILTATGIVLGLFLVVGMIWPRCNVVLWPLARYGPPLEIAAAIDAELTEEETVQRFGQPLRSFHISETDRFPIILTPSWLLQFSEVGLCAARLDDIVLFNKKVRTRRNPLGVKDQRCSVVVQERSGRVAEFTQSEPEVDRLLRYLLVLLPDVAAASS